MSSYATGRVTEVIGRRRGLEKLKVDLGDRVERAYALTDLVPGAEIGDRVVVNTTAVDRNLGTGGWHFVVWNLEHDRVSIPGPGHIMKLRYTGMQRDVGAAEEEFPELCEVSEAPGLPVVALALHSQLPAACVAIRQVAPGARIGYMMTDGASLPIALSDMVDQLRERDLLDITVTARNAFGGDLEAITLHSGVIAAQHAAGCDILLAGVGPGIVGTASTWGNTALDVTEILHATQAVGARGIAALRVSFADPRVRHQGISHHSRTALGQALLCEVTIPIPAPGSHVPTQQLDEVRRQLASSPLISRHTVVHVDTPDVVALFDQMGLKVSSMGRPSTEDPMLFLTAAAAAVYAASSIRNESDGS